MHNISKEDSSGVPPELRQDFGDRLRKSLQAAHMSVGDIGQPVWRLQKHAWIHWRGHRSVGRQPGD